MADINSKLEIGVTTGPIRGSRKIHVGPLGVAMREISLEPSSGEPPVRVYDTSGPYTDPTVTIDVNAGLSRNRLAWVKERGGVEEYDGREIQPIDNGNVTGKHLARRTVLRGLGVTVSMDGAKKQVTKGAWEIRNLSLARDGTKWFISAGMEHPNELHFYSMPLAGGELTRLDRHSRQVRERFEQFSLLLGKACPLAIAHYHDTQDFPLPLQRNFNG
jgi:hypothetical protein